MCCHVPFKVYTICFRTSPFALRPFNFLLPTSSFAATPGLPFTEDFSDQNLLDVANSNARWSTEEMQLIMADPNGDLHKATAFEFIRTQWDDMVESDVSKVNRTEVGKRINFGLIYGSEGHALVKTGKWYDANGIERKEFANVH